MNIIPETAPKRLTSENIFSNDILIVYAYSKVPKLYVMELITTEEVMDRLDKFQPRFGKIGEYGLWYLERISLDAGTQFTFTEFQDACQTHSVNLTLEDPDHQ